MEITEIEILSLENGNPPHLMDCVDLVDTVEEAEIIVKELQSEYPNHEIWWEIK